MIVPTPSLRTGLRRLTVLASLCMLLALAWPTARAQVSSEYCGSLAAPPGRFGPYDYRPDQYLLTRPPGEMRSHEHLLKLINDAHFTAEVETLRRGVTTVAIGGDLSFALRAFPNHHRALLAMMRLGEKFKSPQPDRAELPVECWFERGIRFRPNDTIVRMLYAIYLHTNGRIDEARHQLEQSLKIAGDNAFTIYNAGLIYFDIKDYEKALEQAHRAQQLGLLNLGLSEQLKAVGKWREPPPEAPAEAASAAGTAASAPAPAASGTCAS